MKKSKKLQKLHKKKIFRTIKRNSKKKIKKSKSKKNKSKKTKIRNKKKKRKFINIGGNDTDYDTGDDKVVLKNTLLPIFIWYELFKDDDKRQDFKQKVVTFLNDNYLIDKSKSPEELSIEKFKTFLKNQLKNQPNKTKKDNIFTKKLLIEISFLSKKSHSALETFYTQRRSDLVSEFEDYKDNETTGLSQAMKEINQMIQQKKKDKFTLNFMKKYEWDILTAEKKEINQSRKPTKADFEKVNEGDIKFWKHKTCGISQEGGAATAATAADAADAADAAVATATAPCTYCRPQYDNVSMFFRTEGDHIIADIFASDSLKNGDQVKLRNLFGKIHEEVREVEGERGFVRNTNNIIFYGSWPTIPENALCYLYNVKNISFERCPFCGDEPNIKTIEQMALQGCTELETLNYCEVWRFSDTINIENYSCSYLNLKYLDFSSCEEITIGDDVFFGCQSLEQVIFPPEKCLKPDDNSENIKIKIGNGCFLNCPKFKSLYIHIIPNYIYADKQINEKWIKEHIETIFGSLHTNDGAKINDELITDYISGFCNTASDVQ